MRPMALKSLPLNDLAKHVILAPHVVLLGAGASRAAFPNGDRSRRLPLMNDIVEVLQIGPLLERAGISDSNLEGVYDVLARTPAYSEIRAELESTIDRYFSSLSLPDLVTAYDELLLCLRPKDIVATFNWDPLLVQAYRRNAHLRDLPYIAFLHGNVSIGSCAKDRQKGYSWQSCVVCGAPLQRSPLLFPIRDKNYRRDPFIANEWAELEVRLKQAFIFTIFGYSAPAADAAARELLHQYVGGNPSWEFAQVELVDIRERKELEDSWQTLFVRQHYGITRSIRSTEAFMFPRRSCDALAGAILQQDPWHERPLPPFENLLDLQRWVGTLIDEEHAYEDSGVPFRIWRANTTSS